MMGRAADDRVGFFYESYRDIGADWGQDLTRGVIHRKRLERPPCAGPCPSVADPIEPITYYVDPTVPEEFRDAVRTGVERWRVAFEAAGFSNAIRAVLPCVRWDGYVVVVVVVDLCGGFVWREFVVPFW